MTANAETYLGFYLPQAVWVGDPIDLSTFANIREAARQIDQITYSRSCQNLKLKAYRDGLFMLHIPQMEEHRPASQPAEIDEAISWWNRYLEYANTFFLILDSSLIRHERFAYLELGEISKHDIWAATYEGEVLKGMGHAGHTQTAASFLYSRRHLVQQFGDDFDSMLEFQCPASDIPANHYRGKIEGLFFLTIPWRGIHTLSTEVLNATVSQFDDILATDHSAVPLLAELAKAIAQYKIGDFEVALSLSWFVIEKLLSAEWERFLCDKNADLQGGAKRINSDRRQRLNGRDYPASVRLNVLELNDIISFDLYQQIDRIREYRNKVIHRDKNFICSRPNAIEAIHTANSLINLQFSIDIVINDSVSTMGV